MTTCDIAIIIGCVMLLLICFYIDLLLRELSNMYKEKKRFDEYDERREF